MNGSTTCPLRDPVLWPHTLSSGPESGLTNQIYALVGYVIITVDSGCSGLVLPNFTSHDRGGVDVPFAALFQVRPFVNALAAQGVAVYERLSPQDDYTRPRVIAGWHKHLNFIKKRALLEGVHPFQRFEDAVYKSLHVSRQIREKLEQAKVTAGLKQEQGYGCMHARVEIDIRGSWREVYAGPPPTLAQYFRGMSQFAELRKQKQVFVATGKALARHDDEMLSRPTDWGAELVRSTGPLKAWHRSDGKGNLSKPSYIVASLVDMMICREARWFVGWCGSTFARMLAHYHAVDHGRGWFSVCPESTQQSTLQDLHAKWSLCSDPRDGDPTGVESQHAIAEAFSVVKARKTELRRIGHEKKLRAQANGQHVNTSQPM
eukprot:CAMPEP_0119320650 /NCGR_PEP_ID=MMETSP1333-20130426/53019_1 /TAXON_ID=418940 /ORGANISM="Scyphosphaera apsteinii, Strain RCC1455" /LENGTH=374 /DNA_ID=CAMNT_0007327413 /DNA_START=188 /DNA_END=1312 /DNA_ORIENTATION=+